MGDVLSQKEIDKLLEELLGNNSQESKKDDEKK